MDGNHILSELRSMKSWNGFETKVKDFLSSTPSNSKKPISSPANCELFSLKLLKLCTERLQSKQCTEAAAKIGSVCIKNLTLTSGKSGKVPKLGFEKILLHFSKACLANNLIHECEEALTVLHTQLNKNEGTTSSDKSELYQHSHGILWQASVRATNNSVPLERVLNLQKLALKCLLASDENNLQLVIEKALKAEQVYTKSNRSPDSEVGKECYEVLYNFHRGVLDIEQHLINGLSCQVFVPVSQYALCVVRVCVETGRTDEGCGLLSRVCGLVSGHRCKVCVKSDLELLKCQTKAVGIWMALNSRDWLSNDNRAHLQELVLDLSKLSSSKTTPSCLLKLIESLEMVIVRVLHTHREALLLEGCSKDSRVFQQIRSLLTISVSLVDVVLKNPPRDAPATLNQRGRKRQLTLLCFHTSILVDLLTSSMELEGSRSSNCSTIPQEYTHKNLATSFYPVLKQSQDILKNAGSNLCVSEHRWLGVDAVNIAQALLDHGKLQEACDVLSLAMEEFTTWVVDGGDTDTQISRAKETHIEWVLQKLVEVQGKVHHCETVLTTLNQALSSLPHSLLSSCDFMEIIVSQWVRTKELISAEEAGASPSKKLGQTVVENAKGLSNQLKIQYLEHELATGKASSLSPSVLLSVVEALLSLHTSPLEKTRLTIEKAVLLRGCGQSCALLDETIETLTQIKAPGANEQLAIAHLWKAICVGEQIIGSCAAPDGIVTSSNEGGKPRDEAEQEREIALSREEEELMMSDDITQCLYSSVESWEKLSELKTALSDLSRDYLSLTVQFSLAHSQPVLALRTLRVLLALLTRAHTSTQVTVTRLTTLALYSDLSLSLGELSSYCLAELEKATEESVPCGLTRRDALEVSVALCTCRLALARAYLHRGQLDSSRDLLLSVLNDSCLKETCSLTFDLAAKAHLLMADLVQQESFEVKCTDDFLKRLGQANERGSFRLTPMELVIDACRILTRLANHKRVLKGSQQPADDLNKAFVETESISTSSASEEATPTFSSSVGAWQILVSVLESLQRVSQLYLCQGNLKKAHGKAREGAMMARRISLQGWYVEFLLLLVEIQTVWGSYSLSTIHSTQAAKLLDCTLPGGNKDKELPRGSKDKEEVSRGTKRREKVKNENKHADVSLISIDSDESSDSSLLQGQQQFSPSTHPHKCECTLCSSVISTSQTGRLLALSCSSTLEQTTQPMGPLSSQQERDGVATVISQLISVLHKGKELVDKRGHQCQAALSCHTQHKKEQTKKSKSSKKHTTSDSSTCPAFTVTQIDLSLVIGSCHLAVLQPNRAVDHITSTLTSLALPQNVETLNKYVHYSHPLSLCLAKAQFTLAVARLQETELAHPGLAQQLWTSHTSAADKENKSSAPEVKRSTRSGKARRTRNTKALSDMNTGAVSQREEKEDHCTKSITPFPREPVDHLVLSYQLGSTLSSFQLVRDSCRWLSVLLSVDPSMASLSPLLLAESMQVSLKYQASLSLGVKIRGQSSKTPLQHASEAVSTLTPHTPSQSLLSPLHKARQTLLTSTPPSPATLPHNWRVCTIAPAPTTHYTHPTHLLISQTAEQPKPKKTVKSKSKPPTSKEENGLFVKVVLPEGGLGKFLRQFEELQARVKKSIEPCEIRKWWAARRQLDKEMKELFGKFERECVGMLLTPLAGEAVILMLGERVVGLPWETLSVFKDKVACRMPSLKFTIAHKHMVDHSGEVSLDRSSAFYVLNPQGDLHKTETVFADWFSMQEGWEGVVGRSPTDQEFTSALQDKDLYVYCGHSYGNFLTGSAFQQISCRSVAFLIGCSSAHLQGKGRCDPSGAVFRFLVSGCPAVVGCLWDVTDGEIDRFSRALLKSTATDTSLYLPQMVASSRCVCKLPWVTGAAPVVYGIPVTFRD